MVKLENYEQSTVLYENDSILIYRAVDKSTNDPMIVKRIKSVQLPEEKLAL